MEFWNGEVEPFAADPEELQPLFNDWVAAGRPSVVEISGMVIPEEEGDPFPWSRAIDIDPNATFGEWRSSIYGGVRADIADRRQEGDDDYGEPHTLTGMSF